VWHLFDPDTSAEINLEKDIMIGFAAVNLSILMAGFTAVSGWFDIMDFTEKRNGQIKVNFCDNSEFDIQLNISLIYFNIFFNLLLDKYNTSGCAIRKNYTNWRY